MKIYIQSLFISAFASVALADSSILETQDAIMQDIPAMIREHTLGDKQIINGCTVTSKLVTKQSLEGRNLDRFKDRMCEEKSYLLITVSAGKREKKTLGGGTLIILYDRDTCERIDFFRTR